MPSSVDDILRICNSYSGGFEPTAADMTITAASLKTGFINLVTEAEPDSLQSFVVWLEVKIAQYKLYGCMSLEINDGPSVFREGVKKKQQHVLPSVATAPSGLYTQRETALHSTVPSMCDKTPTTQSARHLFEEYSDDLLDLSMGNKNSPVEHQRAPSSGNLENVHYQNGGPVNLKVNQPGAMETAGHTAPSGEYSVLDFSYQTGQSNKYPQIESNVVVSHSNGHQSMEPSTGGPWLEPPCLTTDGQNSSVGSECEFRTQHFDQYRHTDSSVNGQENTNDLPNRMNSSYLMENEQGGTGLEQSCGTPNVDLPSCTMITLDNRSNKDDPILAFRCDLCGRVMLSYAGYKGHMNRIHKVDSSRSDNKRQPFKKQTKKNRLTSNSRSSRKADKLEVLHANSVRRSPVDISMSLQNGEFQMKKTNRQNIEEQDLGTDTSPKPLAEVNTPPMSQSIGLSDNFTQNDLRLHDILSSWEDEIHDGNDDPYEMDKCTDQQFTDSRSSMINNGTFMWCCPICDKMFRHLSSLNRHLKVHQGLYTNHCLDCDRKFTRKEHFLQHKCVSKRMAAKLNA